VSEMARKEFTLSGPFPSEAPRAMIIGLK
jgi:hypothetical protein